MKWYQFPVTAAVILLLSACATVPDDVMTQENHQAARSLLRNADDALDVSPVMIAATLANIDDLSSSSSFGRVASQQLVSEFTRNGHHVVDILLRNNIYMDEQEGEFLLSREIANIRADYQADVVLAGTYAVGNRQVFVTAKLIRTTDGMILASHDYAIPYEGEVRALITGEQQEPPPTLVEQLFRL